jgi:alpha-ribazole phosphatase
LEEGFEQEAEAVRHELKGVEPALVLSSPSLRCRELAGYLSGGRYETSPELAELDFGEWELKAWDAIPREALDLWAADFAEKACPGGESLGDLKARVLALWEALPQRKMSPVFIVTHGGPIRVILNHVEGLGDRDLFSRPVPFGGVFRLGDR